MDKNLVIVTALIAVMGAGAWYQHRPAFPKTAPGAVAKGKPMPGVAPARTAAVPAAPNPPADQQAARTEIDNALHGLKVTSILLGDPAIVIINKSEYSTGDPLNLPGGKTLQVTGITEDGVALGYNGMAFHLAAPAAPDLAASRKAR